MKMQNIMGIDIGGTKCSLVLGEYCPEDKDITIKDKVKFPTESQHGLNHTLEKIFNAANKIIENNTLTYKDISGCGISCGGPLNSKEGIIMSPPNLRGWDNVNIVKIIESRFGIKAYIQNDANACALAEWKFGAGKGHSNIVFLTFGTGIGAGLILNGRLYSGTNDMAGEVGHIRLSENGPVGYGKTGSFEGFCSGGGIAQIAKAKVLEKIQTGQSVSFCESKDELNKITAKKVALSAKAGDPLAVEIYETSAKYLGKGLSILIDILNPEIIIMFFQV
jgi:glucokinase